MKTTLRNLDYPIDSWEPLEVDILKAVLWGDQSCVSIIQDSWEERATMKARKLVRRLYNNSEDW